MHYFPAWIGVGSNMGDKVKNCCMAVTHIADHPCLTITGLSHLYGSAPVGNTNQDWFVNGVIQVETKLSSLELMEQLLLIEKKMGRIRHEKWGPRNIDMDLIMYADEVRNLSFLRLPHPRMHERLFVLKPLSDLSPELRHPTFDLSISELMERVTQNPGDIWPLGADALPWDKIRRNYHEIFHRHGQCG